MNTHNPIALAISQLQEKWRDSIPDDDYQLVRWLIKKDNLDIFKGFLKLESTAYGSLEETFVVLFTPFEETQTFVYSLASDWIAMFEEEYSQGKLPTWGDFESLKEELKNLPSENISEEEGVRFFIKLLSSFYAYVGKKTKLVVGLLPYGISDYRAYTKSIHILLKSLPSEVALMTVDYVGQEKQDKLFAKDYPGRINIRVNELNDAGQIYRQMATAGNPDDPQVAFRVCMFEMGDAAKANNKSAVQHWGEKGLLVAQSSGDKLFWASAHLVYAGFLFGFKDSQKIEILLHNGKQLMEQLLANDPDNTGAVGLLAQFYNYQGAYQSIIKKYKESIASFNQQATILLKSNQVVPSIGAFQNALLVASKHQKSSIKDIAEKGFSAGYSLEDEQLRSSGFPIIAYYYLKCCTVEEKEQMQIEERMAYLYTPDWKRNARKHLAIAPEEYVS